MDNSDIYELLENIAPFGQGTRAQAVVRFCHANGYVVQQRTYTAPSYHTITVNGNDVTFDANNLESIEVALRHVKKLKPKKKAKTRKADAEPSTVETEPEAEPVEKGEAK